jgi:hypothetical protein
MSTTVNSIPAYVTSITGTATTFVRVAAVAPGDVALFDARETAAAAVAGYQVVDCGAVVGGDATGLANDATAYTATITVDGVGKSISVVGSAAQTYTTLIAEIDTDLAAAATTAIVAGTLVITSATTGNDSLVTITDVDLFATLTEFVAIATAVQGDLATDMLTQTLVNNANMYDAYKGAIETYDTASDRVLLDSDAGYAAGANPTAAEFAVVVDMVNAMRDNFDHNTR